MAERCHPTASRVGCRLPPTSPAPRRLAPSSWAALFTHTGALPPLSSFPAAMVNGGGVMAVVDMNGNQHHPRGVHEGPAQQVVRYRHLRTMPMLSSAAISLSTTCCRALLNDAALVLPTQTKNTDQRFGVCFQQQSGGVRRRVGGGVGCIGARRTAIVGIPQNM